MKKLYTSLAFVIFTLSINGQPSNTTDTTATAKAADSNTASSVVEVKVAPKTGKIEIPPEKANPVTVPKFAAPVVIDGKPDEELWKTAAVFKDFYQTYPGDNSAPSKPTEMYMMYDEKHLYIAFKCWDERDKIRATIAKRDEVFGEDNVRIWLDTYNDQRRAYVLGFNPLGVQQDGIYTEGRGYDYTVDVVMESKGVVEDWGWSIEAKIPFKSLRYSAGKGKFWGFNAARNIDRFNDELDQWYPDDRNISGFLIKFGKITGLDGIKYERTLEVVPSITVSETGSRVQANEFAGGRWVNQPVKQDIGVTLKYNLSPNVTLDAAINPDFAEIEADAPVITANQRFPIFFEEKRPFFLEGVDIFQSPFNIFHSRNIVDPDFAAKLTGKIGKTTFGFLAASDKAPGNFEENSRNDPAVRSRIDEFIDKNALFGVLRLKQDFGKENSVGLFATYRGFPEQKNLLVSLDGRFKFNDRTVSQFQLIGTHTRDCFFDSEFDPSIDPVQAERNREICGSGALPTDRTDPNTTPGTFDSYRTGNGIGYYWNLDYTTKNHGWFFEAGGRSKNYRADAGFTRRTNTNFLFFINRLSTEPKPKAKIIQVQWRQGTGVNYDWQGRLTDFNLFTNTNITLQRTTFLWLETGIYRERIFEEEFGLKRSATRPGAFAGAPERAVWQHYASGELSTTPIKKFTLGLFMGHIINAYDFDFGNSPQDPGPGRQFDVSIFAEFKPVDPFRISLRYQKARLVRNDNSARTVDTDLVTLRSTYQFTRFLFTRMRLDYNSDRKNFAGQLLFGWNPNPGTAFYVGYNDNTNYNGFNPFSGDHEPGFARNSRTFFIRASYLFRKSF